MVKGVIPRGERGRPAFVKAENLMEKGNTHREEHKTDDVKNVSIHI